MNARALVRTVLAPHHAENPELRIRRLAAQNIHDLLVFRKSELVLGDDLGRKRRRTHAGTAALNIEWNTTNPSVDPISGSVARSGWGIIPITFRSRFKTPAMSRIDPFALSTYRKA